MIEVFRVPPRTILLLVGSRARGKRGSIRSLLVIGVMNGVYVAEFDCKSSKEPLLPL
jgi:hypothetical protein